MHELAHINNVCQFVLDFQKHPKKNSIYNWGKKIRLLNEPDIYVFSFFASTRALIFNKHPSCKINRRIRWPGKFTGPI